VPSLYNYFAGLMDIYDALFRAGFTLWGEHLNAHARGADTWQDQVRQTLEAYMTFAMENPELYQLLRANHIEIDVACTLILLAISQY
jgi:AcrR family transcriptional regulator